MQAWETPGTVRKGTERGQIALQYYRENKTSLVLFENYLKIPNANVNILFMPEKALGLGS